MNDFTDKLRQREGYKRTAQSHTKNENYEYHENSMPPDGDFSSFSCFSSPSKERPRLASAALYGPAGEIVRRLAPHTEADPAAMYAQLLAGLGSLIGNGAYFLADGSRHHPNLFTVICGRTAKARKGTSWARVKSVLSELDDLWLTTRVKSGVVSGEGVTEALRDDADKRLLLYEGEFGQVLQSMKREGNTVSVLLRSAWDGVRLAVLRRKDPIDVEGAHVSMIGHITLPELHRLLASVEISNGLANRCLWVFADRERLLPEGGVAPDLGAPMEKLHAAITSARDRGQVKRDPSARELWATMYSDLSQEPPGKMGEILSRGEAQVMRLALLFALLDAAPAITCQHLTAALSLWRYCEASASHIFVDNLISPMARKILNALAGESLTMSQVHAIFHNNAKKAEIENALSELKGQIEIEAGGMGGKQTIRLKRESEPAMPA
jgi:Protein of unknown function (DUF3987)